MRISDMCHFLFVQSTRENGDCNSTYRGVSTIRYTYPSACSLRKSSFLDVEAMEPLAKHYGLNHKMVSFQAETAARYLERKHK